MFETKKALRLKLKNMAADYASEMEKSNQYAQANKRLMNRDEKLFDDNVKMVERIDKLNGELAKVSELLAKAENERDAWREKYREEADDNYAKEFKLEEYAGFETLDDLISAYHKALDDLYAVRERMTRRVPVRRRKDGAVRRAT